ncbi:MAG: hypothetical protein AAGH64_08295 [Planctomycetota bacterium]
MSTFRLLIACVAFVSVMNAGAARASDRVADIARELVSRSVLADASAGDAPASIVMRTRLDGSELVMRFDRVFRREAGGPIVAVGDATMGGDGSVPGRVLIATDGTHAFGAAWLDSGPIELSSHDGRLTMRPAQIDVPLCGLCTDCGGSAGVLPTLFPIHAGKPLPPDARPAEMVFDDAPDDDPIGPAFAGRSPELNDIPGLVDVGSGPPCYSGVAGIVTVLMPYTEEAIDQLGSIEAARVHALAAIESANIVVADSGVRGRYVIADVLEAPELTEGFDAPFVISGSTLLDRVRSGPEGESVRIRREEKCADMIGAIGVFSGVGGLASPANADPVSISNLGGSITFRILAHELGHSMGCGHAVGFGPPGRFPFSRGNILTEPGAAGYATLMAGNAGFAGGLLSGPDVLFLGTFPTGVTNETDNAFTHQDSFDGTRSRLRERPFISGDCDGDGVNDVLTLLGNTALDMNYNGIVDLCEVRDDPTLDLNGNGILDEAEEAGVGVIDLGERVLTPGMPTSFPFPDGTVFPETDVVTTLLVSVDADLTGSERTVALEANPIGRTFTIDAPGVAPCAEPAYGVVLLFDDDYAGLKAAGAGAEVVLTPSMSVDPFSCAGPITARVQLYVRPPLETLPDEFFDLEEGPDPDPEPIPEGCDCDDLDAAPGGGINQSDLSAFLTLVEFSILLGTNDGDFNEDGSTDFLDIADYLGCFEACSQF